MCHSISDKELLSPAATQKNQTPHHEILVTTILLHHFLINEMLLKLVQLQLLFMVSL